MNAKSRLTVIAGGIVLVGVAVSIFMYTHHKRNVRDAHYEIMAISFKRRITLAIQMHYTHEGKLPESFAGIFGRTPHDCFSLTTEDRAEIIDHELDYDRIVKQILPQIFDESLKECATLVPEWDKRIQAFTEKLKSSEGNLRAQLELYTTHYEFAPVKFLEELVKHGANEDDLRLLLENSTKHLYAYRVLEQIEPKIFQTKVLEENNIILLRVLAYNFELKNSRRPMNSEELIHFYQENNKELVVPAEVTVEIRNPTCEVNEGVLFDFITWASVAFQYYDTQISEDKIVSEIIKSVKSKP